MAGKRAVTVVIADELRQRIVSGQIATGERLTEAGVASEFETSRTPVRDAFKQLESEGFVELRPYRGVVVLGVNLDDIKDYYELFGLLASYAVEKATNRVPQRVIKEMVVFVTKLKEHYEERDYYAMFEIHNTLCGLLIGLCDNKRLAGLLSGLMGPFQRFRLMVGDEECGKDFISFYEGLVAAFRERDPQRAAFLAAKHSGETSVGVLRSIQKQ